VSLGPRVYLHPTTIWQARGERHVRFGPNWAPPLPTAQTNCKRSLPSSLLNPHILFKLRNCHNFIIQLQLHLFQIQWHACNFGCPQINNNKKKTFGKLDAVI